MTSTSRDQMRHYAVIDPYERRLTLLMGETKIAETTNAFILKEVGKSVYNPALYIPKEDILIDLELEASRQSYCPIKGDATYWNIPGAPTPKYFAWSYENPHPRSTKIAGHISFNLQYITIMSAPLK